MSKNTKYVGATIPCNVAEAMEKRAKKETRSVSGMYTVAAKYYLNNVGEEINYKK